MSCFFLENRGSAGSGDEILSYNMMDGDDMPLPWMEDVVGETRAEMETLRLVEAAQAWTMATGDHDSTASLNTQDVSLITLHKSRSRTASATTATSEDSPTDAALQLLQLQGDTPPPPLPTMNSADNVTAVDDEPSLLRGMDGMLEEFSSVFKFLAAGAPVDADDDHNVAITEIMIPMKHAPVFDTPLAPKTTVGTVVNAGRSSLDDAKPKAIATPTTSWATRGPFVGDDSHNNNNANKHQQKPKQAEAFTTTEKRPVRPSLVRSKSQSKAASSKATKTAARKSATIKKVVAAPTVSAKELAFNRPVATTKTKPRKAKSKPIPTRKRAAQGSLESKSSFKKLNTNLNNVLNYAPSPTETVGPSSSQMQVVNLMITYMRQTYTDSTLLDEILQTVDYCVERHFKNEASFKHLPGAIFENFLEILSPDEFLRVFQMVRSSTSQASVLIEHPLPREQVKSSASSDTETSVPTVPEQAPPPIVVAAAPDYLPNVVEAAVGYGFHLSRLHRPDMDVDFHTFLTKGAVTIMNMSAEERCLFWKYMMHPSTAFHQAN